jgi:hypothetical protein
VASAAATARINFPNSACKGAGPACACALKDAQRRAMPRCDWKTSMPSHQKHCVFVFVTSRAACCPTQQSRVVWFDFFIFVISITNTNKGCEKLFLFQKIT